MRKQDKRHRKVRKCIHGPHSLGQHLLHSKKLVRELIRNFGIGSRDTVLDIGAGKGALTLPLAEKAGDVWAVELDPDFAQALRKKTENCRNVRVIQGDFLNCRLPARPFCVVSSIPYAITTPIMEKLLAPASSGLQRAVIVMEKGAAKRFTGVPVTDPRILSWRMWFELQMGKNDFPLSLFATAGRRIGRAVHTAETGPRCFAAQLFSFQGAGRTRIEASATSAFRGVQRHLYGSPDCAPGP